MSSSLPASEEAEENPVVVIKDRCKGCLICVHFCPKHVLERGSEPNAHGYIPVVVKRPEACIRCGKCELLCPDFAIYVKR